MIGSLAERNLLGALILEPTLYAQIEAITTEGQFEDGRLGQVFTVLQQLLSRGEAVDQIVVQNEIRTRGIRLPDTFVFEAATADVYPYAIVEYAEAVRADAVRRATRMALNTGDQLMREGMDPLAVAARMEGMLREVVAGSGPGTLRAKSLREILAMPDTYDWVIEGLLEKHDRLIVTGPEGSGKSTLVRQLLVLPAAGVHPMRFSPIEPMSALVIDAENTEKQWRRATQFMARRAAVSGHRDPSDHVHVVAGKRLDIVNGPLLGEIHRLIDQHQPQLVYMGPIYKLVPHAVHTDDEAAPLITALDSIRERDVALIMEAHAGHAQQTGGGRDLRPRGSSALLGWPEFGFGIRPHDDDPNIVSVGRWRGDREAREWPSHLIRGTAWPWEPTASPS